MTPIRGIRGTLVLRLPQAGKKDGRGSVCFAPSSYQLMQLCVIVKTRRDDEVIIHNAGQR